MLLKLKTIQWKKMKKELNDCCNHLSTLGRRSTFFTLKKGYQLYICKKNFCCCERHWNILLKHIARKMTVAGIRSNRAWMNCWIRILLLLLHFLLNLLFPLFLLLYSILKNSFKTAYVHTMYFEHICYPLLLISPKSIPLVFQFSNFKICQNDNMYGIK